MDLSDFRASASIIIAVAPEKLYGFISDLPRMGEISPENTGGEWEGDARGAGATFIGSNTSDDRFWQTRIRVTVADPPREFAWETMGGIANHEGQSNNRWSYLFTPVPGGTKVEESWTLLRIVPQLEARGEEFMTGLPASMRANMEDTLAKLKALHEG